MLSCVRPFRTLHLLWTRNNPLTKLVLHNQHVLSFMKSMSGSLNINTQRRMTPFRPRPLRSFLASLVNLPSMILHVCLHPQMHPFSITRRTHRMLVHHSTTERISYSLKIHFILYLFFWKHRGWVRALFIYLSIWFIWSWGCQRIHWFFLSWWSWSICFQFRSW